MSNNVKWNSPDTLPDESVGQIWYHRGDGCAYLYDKDEMAVWSDCFRVRNICGWLPLVPPVAPQPPTQAELDNEACFIAHKYRTMDFADHTPADIPHEFAQGWNAALKYARSK